MNPEVHDKPGVGIGLYLARTIMELQKGYIEVQSGSGKRGASFRLYFFFFSSERSITQLIKGFIYNLVIIKK